MKNVVNGPLFSPLTHKKGGYGDTKNCSSGSAIEPRHDRILLSRSLFNDGLQPSDSCSPLGLGEGRVTTVNGRFTYRLRDLSGIRSGGGLALSVSRLTELTSDESKVLLREIRDCGLSVAAVAALLGTSYGTVRAWADGKRSPSRCARRSLWLLHRLLTKTEPISLDELISCGRIN